MFEDYTYEALMSEVLANAPDGIDTRQGSIFYDAVSGVMLKIAKLYTDLDLVLSSVFLTTATGEYLDARAAEYGLTRQAGSAAQYVLGYNVSDGYDEDEVVDACIGGRFFYDGLYFVVTQSGEGNLYLTAEDVGTSYNYITSGTAATPVNTIEGLAGATFGVLYEAGTDDEDDDSLRERIQNEIAGPAENGNKAHYKSWCESVDGVGKARIFPLWGGPNTVMAVLISSDGTPVSSEVIEAVQNYIDPIDEGYEYFVDYDTDSTFAGTYILGDGLGEGVANLGAHFIATSPEKSISVVIVDLVTSFTEPEDMATLVENIHNIVVAYFKSLALGDNWSGGIELTGKMLGAQILTQISEASDYNVIEFSGQENYSLTSADIPTVAGLSLYFINSAGDFYYDRWSYVMSDGRVHRRLYSEDGESVTDTYYVKDGDAWVEDTE